jgi:DNA-binding ferritin-like protein
MRDAAEFLLVLLHSATNTHILHWQTKSYAEHVALGKYYEEIVDLIDQLAEAMMGKFDTTPEFPEMYIAPAATGKEQLEELKEYVEEARKDLPQDSEIQNIIDEVAQLIDSTLYLLRFP